MGAQTLNCPTCGASISSDETTCRYCGSRLAIIACPQCFGMMFVGSKFCPHCGAAAAPPVTAGEPLKCPNCSVLMKPMLLKQTPLQECQTCFGIWLDDQAFDRVCADRERQADVLSNQLPPPRIIPAPVRYRPCPRCGQLMNRVNYARISGVIVDQCVGHGFWFDRDELRRVIDFLRAGGVQFAKMRQDEEAARERQQAENEQRRESAFKASGDGYEVDDFPSLMRTLGKIIGRL